MGNAPSNNCGSSNVLANLVAQRQPSPPPDPMSICDAKRIEFGQLERDVVNKQDELDKCFPAEREARIVANYIAQMAIFIREKTLEFNSIDLKRPLQVMEKIKNAEIISKEYIEKLRKEHKSIESETTEMDHIERRYRRKFLDTGPQDGVPPHVLGFQTSDDMIMLLFWISFLFVLSIAVYYGSAYYNLSITAIVMAFAVPLGAAYYCITIYG
jgi:hypothetical protein